ncbi:MAG: aspartate aminotransferase family protein [Planctomycetota bacterium]|nr:MAG: aspartate aminotransferase family protein [Planctomycetota bacterium]
MAEPIVFPGEHQSNAAREVIARHEPHGLRTFTPSQAVLARAAGPFVFTPEGRRLWDYTSGVLVANLGHNPAGWWQRVCELMGWVREHAKPPAEGGDAAAQEYLPAAPLTAYNAITPLEVQAVEALLRVARRTPCGEKLDGVMWAASGSEAVQKALWACLRRDRERPIILATRHGFHGKKGLAGAVTGTEHDPERDPRVRFIAFPREEIDDVSKQAELDLQPYAAELDAVWQELGRRIGTLITEPYLGGGGSYHPPSAYLQLLQRFCDEHDVLLVLDEVQSNFGRTGAMFAFEKHGLRPDFVTLGKGLGNGVPVSAVLGRMDLMELLDYGELSDTWSAHPLGCAAVVATIEQFERDNVLQHVSRLTPVFVEGLDRLKQTGLIAKVRGEGLVFGIEAAPFAGRTAEQVAVEIVRAAYLGEPGGDGVHLLGPLAGRVLRISPPMTITLEQAEDSLGVLQRVLRALAERLVAEPQPTAASG